MPVGRIAGFLILSERVLENAKNTCGNYENATDGSNF